MVTKDIDLLIEKVKNYPNYIAVLSETSGYSVSYVKKMMNGKRKLRLDFIDHLLTISKLIDKKDKAVKKAVESVEISETKNQ